MSTVNRILSVFEKIAYWFLISSIGIMTIVTLIEVFRRYFFGLSFSWSEELVRYLLVWSTFIGGSLAYKNKAIVFFDLLISKLPFKIKRFVDLGINLFILIFIIIIFILSVHSIGTKTVFLQISPGLRLSMAYIYLSIPTGMFFTFIFCLQRIMELFQLKEVKLCS